MSSLFAGLFGPSTQDIIAERQDQLDTSLAGMTNPYERLGLLLGTAVGGRPTQSAAYQAAKAREDEVANIGNNPAARANYLREAIAQGRIPADKLKQAQQAIEALDPTTAMKPITAKELAELNAAYTDESVKQYLSTGDLGVLVSQGTNKAARSVVKDDPDWKAFEGAELQLGEGFYDDLLGAFGPKGITDLGEDNRLEPAKSAVYNLANQIRFNSEQPMTLAQSLKLAKNQMVKEMSNDAFSFLKGSQPAGMAGNNTTTGGGTPAVGNTELVNTSDVPIDGNPIEPPPELVGEDLDESQTSLRNREQNLVNQLELATTKGAKANIRRELNEVRSQIVETTEPKRSNSTASRKSRSSLDPDKKGTGIKKTRAKQSASIEKDIKSIKSKIKFNEEVLKKRPNNKRAADALKALKKDLARNEKTLKSIKSKQ